MIKATSVALALIACGCSVLNESRGPKVTSCADVPVPVCADDIIANCDWGQLVYLFCVDNGQVCGHDDQGALKCMSAGDRDQPRISLDHIAPPPPGSNWHEVWLKNVGDREAYISNAWTNDSNIFAGVSVVHENGARIPPGASVDVFSFALWDGVKGAYSAKIGVEASGGYHWTIAVSGNAK